MPFFGCTGICIAAMARAIAKTGATMHDCMFVQLNRFRRGVKDAASYLKTSRSLCRGGNLPPAAYIIVKRGRRLTQTQKTRLLFAHVSWEIVFYKYVLK